MKNSCLKMKKKVLLMKFKHKEKNMTEKFNSSPETHPENSEKEKIY